MAVFETPREILVQRIQELNAQVEAMQTKLIELSTANSVLRNKNRELHRALDAAYEGK